MRILYLATQFFVVWDTKSYEVVAEVVFWFFDGLAYDLVLELFRVVRCWPGIHSVDSREEKILSPREAARSALDFVKSALL